MEVDLPGDYIIMAEMAVIVRGLAPSNEEDAFGLVFPVSPRVRILTKFRIYSRWRIRRNKPLAVPWFDEKLFLL